MHNFTRYQVKNIRRKNVAIMALLGFIIVLLIGLMSYGLSRNAPAPLVNKPAGISPPQKLPIRNGSQSLYYGVNVDMGELLPSSPYYYKNAKGQDLVDIAHTLGINMFRITNTPLVPTHEKAVMYTKAQWDEVLNKMSAKGIQAIIIMEANSNIVLKNPETLTDDYLHFVSDYFITSGVADNPAVYGVDLKNEPVLTENNVSVLKKAAEMVKAKYPSMKVTVGGWRTETHQKDAKGQDVWNWNLADGIPYLDFVDFYSVHIYNFDKKRADGTYPDSYQTTLDFLKTIKSKAEEKPILITEFGGANGDAISDMDTVGSKQLQATIYNGVYRAVTEMADQGVIGALSYVLAPRNLNPEGWALTENKGENIYPAAYILQQYSLGTAKSALPILASPIPNDIALTGKDIGKSLTITKNDIVSLELQLPVSDAYSLQIDPPDSAYASEALISKKSGVYQSVFHFNQVGTMNLSIIKTETCEPQGCIPERKTMFTTTIHVTN